MFDVSGIPVDKSTNNYLDLDPKLFSEVSTLDPFLGLTTTKASQSINSEFTNQEISDALKGFEQSNNFSANNPYLQNSLFPTQDLRSSNPDMTGQKHPMSPPVVAQPDLVINSITATSAVQGSNLNFSYTIKNQGTGTANSNFTAFYLSNNSTLDSGDTYIGYDDVSSLGAGVTRTESASVALSSSLTSGTYYIFAQADGWNYVSESNENNNITSKAITIEQPSTPDLVINSITATSATAGSNLNFSYTIKNQGTGTANSNFTAFYLSNNSTLDSGDTYIGYDDVSSLGAGVIRTESASVALSSSLTSGTYYIFAQADGWYTVSESNENNNITSKAITIGQPSTPDLVINSITATSATAGSNLNFSYTIKNRGTGTANSNYTAFFLSNNSTLDSGDTYIGYDDVSSLAAGVTRTESASVALSSSLTSGTYYIFAQADGWYTVSESNENNNITSKAITIGNTNNLSFNSFNVVDASGDSTNNSIFQGGAIQLNYGLSSATSLSNVRLEAIGNGNTINLGTWTGASLSNSLINLANFSSLTGGDYQFRAVARTTGGQDFFSNSQPMKILSWNPSSNTIYGTFAGQTLNYSGASSTGTVVVGRGGTDTLNLSGISRSSVTGINGVSLSSFNPSSSTTNQAIFRGTAFDYLTLADGREIYFQGIENLRFGDSTVLELQRRTNDTHFNNQWNLHVSDVDSAWRFTQGSSNVLLVSLDSGILTTSGASGGIVDIATNRLITDPTDDDNSGGNGHGHQAISVMSSTANNGSGVAGINWNSNVYVTDLYGSNGNSRVSLQQGIRDAISYARARNQRVVFQGGIQGEQWLTQSGGTQAQLEQLISNNSDIAIFAVAAGNGNIDIDNTDPNNPSVQQGLSGGVARLQTTHSNVMAVGALENKDAAGNWAHTWVNGLMNAGIVKRAPYSNYGASLTLMAATDSPAMKPTGEMVYMNGTSASNPNLAGIASLVWSVNSSLNGGQLRQILIDTAMDLGTSGKDNTFGNGLVNADAAVRRALALTRNYQLANLYSGRSQFA